MPARYVAAVVAVVVAAAAAVAAVVAAADTYHCCFGVVRIHVAGCCFGVCLVSSGGRECCLEVKQGSVYTGAGDHHVCASTVSLSASWACGSKYTSRCNDKICAGLRTVQMGWFRYCW